MYSNYIRVPCISFLFSLVQCLVLNTDGRASGRSFSGFGRRTWNLEAAPTPSRRNGPSSTTSSSSTTPSRAEGKLSDVGVFELLIASWCAERPLSSTVYIPAPIPLSFFLSPLLSGIVFNLNSCYSCALVARADVRKIFSASWHTVQHRQFKYETLLRASQYYF